MLLETTAEQRRDKRIAQLKARLQKEQALKTNAERKRRNGRLVSLGILFERTIPEMSAEHITTWIERAKTLDKRNSSRVLEAFEIAQGGEKLQHILAKTQDNEEAFAEARSGQCKAYDTVEEVMAALNA